MTNTFKKILGIALIAVSAIFANAGQDDAMLLFRTTGPDRYADGTPVLEGEVYALVWVRDGHAFAGVDLNGEAVDAANSAVVMAHPLAREKVVRGETRAPVSIVTNAAGRAVIDFVADNFPGDAVLFSLMSQFTPMPNTEKFPELQRRITAEENDALYEYMALRGIEYGFWQEPDSATDEMIPKFDNTGV